MSAKEPIVHVTVGPLTTPTLSVAVTVTAAVLPEITVGLAGVKVITGGSVSIATTETVSVAVPSFPAASEAVAVHVAAVSTLTTGAV